MNKPDTKEWREIIALGANDRILSPEMFAAKETKGLSAAHSIADGWTTGAWLDSAQIKTLHWVAYREIFKWAGQERTGNAQVDGESVSPAHLILRDLKTLNITARNWFRSEDPLQNAKEMAAYNAAFRNIYPFANGSEEIGRLILSHQSQSIFGARINLEHDLKVYETTLAQARKGDFESLAKQILEHSPLRVEVQVHAIERHMLEAEKQLLRLERGMSQSF